MIDRARLANGRRQGALDGPAVAVYARGNGRMTHAGFSTPLGECLRSAGVSDKAVGAGVIGLRVLIGPAAILRRVIAVSVDAVKRHAVRPLAHVGQEVFERIAPTVANLYSTTAIPLVTPYIGVGASRLHSGPYGMRAAVGKAVAKVAASRNNLSLEASARSSVIGPQLAAGHDYRAAAIALTKPFALAGCSAGPAYKCRDNQSVIALPHQINRFAHTVQVYT